MLMRAPTLGSADMAAAAERSPGAPPVGRRVECVCGRRAEQLASALKGGCNRGGQALALHQFHCTDSVADVAGWLKQETDARVAAGARARRARRT